VTNINSVDSHREGSEMDIEEVPNLNEDDYQGDFEMNIEGIDEGFQMLKGWAFPANAKFGKKSGAKKIKKKVVGLLKQFFLNGNINAKDKLTAQRMYLELKKFAQSREINDDDIPQVSTIHNWIGRYSREFNEQGTIIALETFKDSSSNSEYE
ncbi:19814_t:CDS:2, partial [Racocetra fulgida]